MTYDEAMNIYKLAYNFDKIDILKRYKELVKLNHPDNCNTPLYSIVDIRKAKDVLINSLQEIVVCKRVKEVIHISIGDLINIYKYKSYNNLDIYKLKNNLCYVNFNIKINNKDYLFTSRLNSKGNYNFEVNLGNIDNNLLEISLLDKSKVICIQSNNILVSFGLDFNVTLVLRVLIR